MLRKIALCWLLLTVIPASGLVAVDAPSRPLSSLRVLYVGTERPEAWSSFLAEHVSKIEVVPRKGFDPARAADFDVILLDWPQGEETREMRLLTSPLGDRNAWNRPTVLLGSAGLNMAVAWKMQGGAGCTCLSPMAYGLREHEIFTGPHRIDSSAMVTIPTPEAFQDELTEKEISVLPVVDDRDKNWKAGWCTHAHYFDKNPDVEFMCGGVNEQTPTSAAIWRQGNFLHFGFEQSPQEMNDVGRKLLLNSIAYIARFTEDRPIAVTPSVFAGPVCRPRTNPERWLKGEAYKVEWVVDMFAPKEKELLTAMPTREEKLAWCRENSAYFHPGSEPKLEIDEDLKQIETAFDQPSFFDRVLGDLDSQDAAAATRARRLLQRYVPCGPGDDATPAAWRTWYRENSPFLFALDTGNYHWYIDPLAKKRNIPTANLHGPARANR